MESQQDKGHARTKEEEDLLVRSNKKVKASVDDNQPWQPNFDANQDILRSLLVWVRIPCLPIEYFDCNFLMRLGAKIGKPIRVADTTSTASRGQ